MLLRCRNHDLICCFHCEVILSDWDELPYPFLHYTRSVRKVSDLFSCEQLMDYNLARLHEPTLNLSAHAEFFPACR
jgi:hypothetical protein